jgi:solute:Na+ symporter, SSS family
VNGIDWTVLLVTILGIAGYGMWRTRGQRSLRTYFHGSRETSWIVIGLSVMATQASAITFLSTPGQGYESGLGFVQNYFGAPFALIIISVVFLPIFRRLNVDTAYEFLGSRFDSKTRLLGAALFLLQRGLSTGITIYAPAIVLSTVLGWRMDLTIIGSGFVAIAYTVSGGSAAVNLTQKYQIGVIFIGMITAFFVLVSKLPGNIGFHDALSVAGGMNRLEGVDFSFDVNKRYTFWSGLLGGLFLALSYFGTDQSQVQRYLSGTSLRESRLGLMFNAICKIPMQFFILLLGVMLFVFYQFEPPPIFFNQTAWNNAIATESGSQLQSLARQYEAECAAAKTAISHWLELSHNDTPALADAARAEAQAAYQQSQATRAEAKRALSAATPHASSNDADYVFVTFILKHLPHGLIGLLITVFLAATLSSKAAELNALGSTTTVDLYRHIIAPQATEAHYLLASRCFTAMWGLIAICFALFANMAENLIQAVNIVGSIFYGVVLGMFLVAFFLRRIGGTAVFYAAIVSQVTVIVLYFTIPISYLWYNFIGCALCIVLSACVQIGLGPIDRGPARGVTPT